MNMTREARQDDSWETRDRRIRILWAQAFPESEEAQHRKQEKGKMQVAARRKAADDSEHERITRHIQSLNHDEKQALDTETKKEINTLIELINRIDGKDDLNKLKDNNAEIGKLLRYTLDLRSKLRIRHIISGSEHFENAIHHIIIEYENLKAVLNDEDRGQNKYTLPDELSVVNE